MNMRSRIGMASAAALVGGLTVTAAAPADAAGHRTASAAQPAASAHTRLWTERGYGFADVKKTWTAQPGWPGRYRGTVSGTVHHYHAPGNRNVLVEVSTDGRIFRLGETSGTRTFSRPYKYTKRVLLRVCLHRPGASGVSFCSRWW
ncbi:hypothetical protein [Streptomyces longwoodensis]|uniref:hypothetical protein n=1 Tax=Streptomyces longwoodensis TaxID=68231 RepID=UPI00384E4890